MTMKISGKAFVKMLKNDDDFKGVGFTNERDPERVAADRAIEEGMRRAKEPEGRSPTPFLTPERKVR